ncbi:enoyl-CoA hydratase-related protein [Domibacillus robiginosus]|uniref:enoyl-CoA hydratase-related protein n=1 Tax=Domibacillus robiginosus TaxID=1071054 RepID=UPI00067E18D1|nr:enoyl-CoA hydratase-related protein [Domibacillus robiginosus]
MKSFSLIQIKVENNIAYVTLKNPPVNALNARMLEELNQCIDGLAEHPSIRATVLTGDGAFFVAGADIKELMSLFEQEEEAKKAAQRGQSLFTKIEKSEKPIIAAINGACLGGGLELAMSCHIRLTAHKAKIGLPETNLGLIPGYGGTQRLARLTNTAKALELILTGQLIDGREAERIGLVNHSVEESQLLAKAAETAELIAQKSRLSVKAAMQSVLTGAALPLQEGQILEAEQFAGLFASKDVQEGVTAFIEKRTPAFKDR